MESAAGRPGACSAGTMKITHPDRLIWPALGIRKIDLVSISSRSANGSCRTWPVGRCTLVRCPGKLE